jgi:hypothetical protein
MIPRRYRPVKAAAIAATLITAVITGLPGERIVESEDIH